MDRGIVRHFRDYRKLLAAVSAIGLWVTYSGQAYSQQRPRFQMPTPEEMFRQNDRNGDGRLSSEEINANPFLPRMLQRTGLDTSRPISERDFIGTMEEARRNWEQNGGRGRGGEGDDDGERRFDRRRDEDDSERRRDDGDNEDSDNEGDEDPDADDEDPRERRSTERKPRPRVTLDLQEDLVAGDADRDGQIAFLEWRSWDGKTLSEFRQLDVNGDGYVTPREVEIIRGPSEDEETEIAAADRRGPRDRDSAEDSDADAEEEAGTDEDQSDDETSRRDRGDRDDQESDSDADPDEQDTDRAGERRSFRGDEQEDDEDRNERDRGSDESPDEARAAAERYFRLLDRDRDGEVASDEWQGGRIRGMFEEDGIDLDESMGEDDFIDHYVRLSSAGG
jgi:hypothetical protein